MITHVKLKLGKSGNVTLIDKEDLTRVKNKKWYYNRNGKTAYAVNPNYKGNDVYLHRFIVNCPPGRVVDHINGDGLDNRKKNLSVCTSSENKISSDKRRISN